VGKGRLEAFSDGVIAIIITIMVLELKVPHGAELASLEPLVPRLLGYALSFVFVGIYWNNHHHMLHATRRISGGILWANLHLLFWLSLIPFATSWVGENPSAPLPTALYGVLLFLAGIAYTILERTIIAVEGRDSVLATAVQGSSKALASIILYASAIGLAFVRPWIADVLYAAVAVIWLVPDRRIEKTLARFGTEGSG
jgi:uncharacterized membrane protein